VFVCVCLCIREKKGAMMVKLTGVKCNPPGVAVKDRHLSYGLTPSNFASVSHFCYFCSL
jgi:hypothetical protein